MADKPQERNGIGGVPIMTAITINLTILSIERMIRVLRQRWAKRELAFPLFVGARNHALISRGFSFGRAIRSTFGCAVPTGGNANPFRLATRNWHFCGQVLKTNRRSLIMGNTISRATAPRNSLDIFSDLEGEMHETVAYLAALDAVLYDRDAAAFREYLVTKLSAKASHVLSEVLTGLRCEFVRRDA